MSLTPGSERQDVLWFTTGRTLTVLSVDEQRREYKRAFASTLLGQRVGHGSQKVAAQAAQTSEATYRRWEDPESSHLPDAFQITLLAELFGCEPADLVTPEELSPREWALTRRAARSAARGARRAQRDEPPPA